MNKISSMILETSIKYIEHNVSSYIFRLELQQKKHEINLKKSQKLHYISI
jgi:hypothetical protein